MRVLLLASVLGIAAVSGGWGRLLAADAAPAPALFDSPVLAKGKGFEIHQQELEDAFSALKATLATQNQAIAARDEARLKERMLERMILTRILLQRATDQDKAEAKVLADKFIADTKKKAPSEESYRRQLIATGLKPEDFEARALEQAIVERVIDRELKANLKVTDEQVRDFYEQGIDVNVRDVEGAVKGMEKSGSQDTVFYRDGTNRLAEIKRANLARLNRPETVKAGLILIYLVDKATREPLPESQLQARRELADQAIKRLQAGEDFAKVAADVSEDPDLLRTKGEYEVTRATTMPPELLTAIFTTPVGQISDPPILTRNGYYILAVKEKRPPGKVPFDQAQKEIRELLLGQGVEKQMPAHADALKKEYEVQVFYKPEAQ